MEATTTTPTMQPRDVSPGAPRMWRDGWYGYARTLRSPNFGERPSGTQVDLIVLHSISLPPGQFGGNEVQELFCNTLDWNAHPYFKSIEGSAVSAHFYIRRTGELWQFVSCDQRAWHAGVSAHHGRANCNDFSVGIELEGLESQSFEQPQYEALSALCAAVAQHYPIAHVAGHEHVAPDRKGDPGMGFDWLQLQRSLGWPAGFFPPVFA